MASSTPLNAEMTENEGTLASPGRILVIDDGTIYDELIAPLETTMMRSIWRIVRDADLAEDSLQDALAMVWKKRFQIRGHPNPQALILKICLDAAYSSLRKLGRMRNQTDLSQLHDVPALSNRDAERHLQEKELEEYVQQAIRRLPRKRALAVMMRLMHDKPFASIAQALGCSEVTVRIHISKGRAQLMKWLTPLYQGSRKEVEK